MTNPAFISVARGQCSYSSGIPHLQKISCSFDAPSSPFSTSLYSLPHNNEERGIKRERRKPAWISLLFAASLLFGSFPNFNDIGEHLFDNKALALELVQTDNTITADDTTNTDIFKSTSKLSDQLFKAMSNRESSSSSMDSLQNIPTNKKQRYWDSMEYGTPEDILSANEKLVDHAVATVSTMYYDSSGGFDFDSQDFYKKWKQFRQSLHSSEKKNNENDFDLLVDSNGLSSRDDVVKTLKSIVSSLNDRYSKYLTREELRMELEGGDNGFLGLGALVDVSPSSSEYETQTPPVSLLEKGDFDRAISRPIQGGVSSFIQQFTLPTSSKSPTILSASQVSNLPVVTAIIPDSPAETAGLVVGDRITQVGEYKFTGLTNKQQVQKALDHFSATDYFGKADITIAKEVDSQPLQSADVDDKYVFENGMYYPKPKRQVPENIVLGYKLSHVNIPTTLTATLDAKNEQKSNPSVVGGDNIVHYQLLSPNDSIFQHSNKIGYIRLTRFSRSSTTGFIAAINSLEEAGAQSYIIDVRNNYGGVIQEAMMTASSLLRDPHSVLCYTLNARGGFKPQENQEYISDPLYNGYLLSSEAKSVARDQVRKEHPEYLKDGGWVSPTSYASLRELRMTRGIKPAHAASIEYLENAAMLDKKDMDISQLAEIMTRKSQKKVAVLINEGTGESHIFVYFVHLHIAHIILCFTYLASAAEVFASSLHDNGRVALVGSKSFGKGLIQHTFPMPDGGGLRLTIAEYLTPSLQHVTRVGEAKYDSGIKPDVRCDSKQGIPQNIGADLCVGVALDVLESQGG